MTAVFIVFCLFVFLVVVVWFVGFFGLTKPFINIVLLLFANATQPSAPLCQASSVNPGVQVSWGNDMRASQTGDRLVYTLAHVAAGGVLHEIFTGPACCFVVSGYAPGTLLRFVVKASNFFGSSPFSAPSDPFMVPQVLRWFYFSAACANSFADCEQRL
jgi:hypothetical protein